MGYLGKPIGNELMNNNTKIYLNLYILPGRLGAHF